MYKLDKSRESCIIFFVTIMYGFHMLRNISLFYPAVVMAICLYFIAISMRNKIYIEYRDIVLFLIFTSLIPIYSIFRFPDVNYLTPSFRFFFIYPFAILVLILMKNQRNYDAIISAILIMVMICCFSLFYEIFFHTSINWLAAASGRSGIVRYSSLAGSLTTLGIVAPLSILFAYYHLKSVFLKISFIAIFIVGSIFTIQKAAVVNLVLVGGILFFYSNYRHRVKIILFGTLVMSILYLYFSDYFYQTIVSVFDHSKAKSYDVTMSMSILQRLWLLPSVLFDKYGLSGMLFGVGLVGGSGLFGLSNFPMNHDGVFDLLFIGGIVYLFLFIILFSNGLLRMRKYLKAYTGDFRARAAYWVLILLLINMIFSGIFYFQPYTGMMFFVTLTYCFGIFKFKNNNHCLDIKCVQV